MQKPTDKHGLIIGTQKSLMMMLFGSYGLAVSNASMAREVCLNYTARISDLRREGFDIRVCNRGDRGLVWYKYHGKVDVVYGPIKSKAQGQQGLSSAEYWFDRCIKQEEALDACIVATVGPRKGEPMVTVPNRADIHEADIVWDGPEAKILIDAALKARR